MYISLPFSLLHSCLINQWKLDKDKNTLHSVLVQEKKEKKTLCLCLYESWSKWIKKVKIKNAMNVTPPPFPTTAWIILWSLHWVYIAFILSKYKKSAGIYCFYITTFNQEIPINAIILKQMLTANLDTVHIVFCRTATANILRHSKCKRASRSLITACLYRYQITYEETQHI